MPRELKADKLARAAEIERVMFAYYGEGACSLDYRDPFTLTCAVVLSAQCTDAAVNKVTPVLFDAYPTPAALAGARVEDVEDIIRTLGFFRSKAKNLVALAQTVCSEFGGVIPADVDALQTLPGVGRKTANCVMCEAFRDPQGIAVDTHVFRIAHRLKLAGPSADTPAKTESALMKVYPQSDWLYINHQWVHFGREFCRARSPRCADCIIGDLCPSRGNA
ncbi:endonuclease III [Xiamenia xianingshaonis]|uniref:Endonuclease III n=1 Tax=Xiamenia xianingshaonis TaxID=2682776 RepID=A0A9E6MRW4_9ACTN|nr:endonuclease III [Xiamenia xianingshaonis]NHM14374.1 endonuclease III [Xiamenia xianingshaonis]QTU84852.1 endonuclease III [Xiamenia xianingshaonis]